MPAAVEEPIVEPEPQVNLQKSELAGNAPAFDEPPVEENIPEPVAEISPEIPVEQPPVEQPVVEQPAVEETPVEQKLRSRTDQAKILRDALRKAMAKQAKIKSTSEQPSAAERLQSRRSMFLGKHATATIKTDSGIPIVEEGAEITDAVFQKARLANKLNELAKFIQ